MTRFAEATTKSGNFKPGWYIMENWLCGKDGQSGCAFLFAYTQGQVNTNPRLVNNCSVMIKLFTSLPEDGVVI